MRAMFSKLFRRGKAAAPEEAAMTPAAAPVAAEPIAPPAEAIRPSKLERFKEQWVENWERHHDSSAPEVIEGNGGNTDWGLWTEAVKAEDNAYAPTEPMPLRPDR